MEHDRKLEIEDPGESEPGDRPGFRIRHVRLIDQALELDPDDAHRPEHVVLRKPDPDVDPADAAAKLEVLLVPGPEEHTLHPLNQRPLEVAHPALSTFQDLP